jgi:nucleotide-binding universal stress UspA family protein
VKVLLVVDKSWHAEQAVRTLCQCFTGADVEVLHVLDLEANPHPHLSAALIDWYHKKIRSLLETEANQFLPKFQALLSTSCRNVRVSIREGRTAEVILQTAASSQCDLIVLGSGGLSEIQSLLLGSVSYRVAQEAVCPVLVVKHELPAIRKVLLAVDRSEGAERAVGFLAERFLLTPCTIVALTVCPSHPFAEVLSESARHEAKASALKYLREIESRFSSRGFTVEPRVVEGDPAAAILTHSAEKEIDLVVTGAGGRHGLLKSWLLGSVSHKVIVHSAKSVLVVHGGSKQAGVELR